MRALLLLLSALILLETTDGVEYDELEEHDREIVDEAIKKANEKPETPKHLDFFKISRSNEKTLIVILKSTTCDASSDGVHRKDCKIQVNAKPQVSCVTCHGIMSCFFLRETDKIKAALNACLPDRVYLNGAGSFLNGGAVHQSGGAVHQSGGAYELFKK